jgi:hypothetical protein
MIEEKTDKNWFRYYDKLPEGYRLATIDDFHFQGRKKIGLEFLIKWVEKEYYQICVMSENLTSLKIKQFIDDNRVFVKK